MIFNEFPDIKKLFSTYLMIHHFISTYLAVIEHTRWRRIISSFCATACVPEDRVLYVRPLKDDNAIQKCSFHFRSQVHSVHFGKI